jgi:hypothetical protein
MLEGGGWDGFSAIQSSFAEPGIGIGVKFHYKNRKHLGKLLEQLIQKKMCYTRCPCKLDLANTKEESDLLMQI